jgi:hypothetical protein
LVRFPAAEILFGGTELKGVALDLATTRARLRLSGEVPELVALRLPDNARRIARRCWPWVARLSLRFCRTPRLSVGGRA